MPFYKMKMIFIPLCVTVAIYYHFKSHNIHNNSVCDIRHVIYITSNNIK
jgi:hypothetical protein